MRSGDNENSSPAVLVMGLGNLLLRDDGVGLRILHELQREFTQDRRIEFVDGGTQGLALTPYLAHRKAALILDAVAMGNKPGTVHYLPDAQNHMIPHGAGSHEYNAGDILRALELLGECPEKVAVVGIEPACVETGVGLSKPVEQAVKVAVAKARDVLIAFIKGIQKSAAGSPLCL